MAASLKREAELGNIGLALILFTIELSTSMFQDQQASKIILKMTDRISSSPDPLGIPDENLCNLSPSKPKRPSIPPRKPLSNTTGNTHVQDFYVTTPSAKAGKSTSTKDLKWRNEVESPWRIRLTVQAEQLNNDDTGAAPIHFTESTTTTTVPLKDDNPEATDGKRGRGRPRKSLDNVPKRTGTPNPKVETRRKTMPDMQATKAEEAWVPTPPKNPRKRGKKDVQGQHERSVFDVDMSGSPTNTPKGQTLNRVVNTKPFPRTKNRSRRKEITPMKMMKHPELESKIRATDTPSTGRSSSQSRHDECPSSTTSHRTREKILERSNQSFLPYNIDQPASSLGRSTLDFEDEKMWRSMIRQDSVSPAATKISLGALQTNVDPTEEHLEYDTILESEGFSMVSVESLHSSGNKAEESTQEEGSGKAQSIQRPKMTRSPTMDFIQPNDSGSSRPLELQTLASVDDISVSQAPQGTSKTVSSNFQTPENAIDALSPPSKPMLSNSHTSQRTIDEPTEGTPKIERVIRAGTALQAVPSPREQEQIHRSTSLASPFNNSENSSRISGVNLSISESEGSPLILRNQAAGIYDGFSAATRRELKAGLRLGEELLKRQQVSLLFSDRSESLSPSGDQAQSSPAYPQLPEVAQVETSAVQRPFVKHNIKYPFATNDQLPSPARSEIEHGEYQRREEVKRTDETPLSSTENDNHASLEHTIDYTMLAKEAEWQSEREAVSKQIQEANPSQVIVIDSGNEDSENEDSLSASVPPSIQDQSPSQVETFIGRSSNVSSRSNVLKPDRSVLPGPSRRSSEDIDGDRVQPNESDLFWQPNLAQTEAVKKRQERKKKKESAHEMSSLSTVRSIRIDCLPTGGTPTTTTPCTPVLKPENEVCAPDTSLIAILETSVSNEKSTIDTTYHEDSEEPGDDYSENLNDKSELTEECIQTTEQLVAMEASISLAQDESAASVPLPDSPTRVPIDPELFVSSREKQVYTESKQTEAKESTKASKSWFTTFTDPFTSLFASKFSLPPATELDLLVALGTEPLPLYRPWTRAHAQVLEGLFHVSTFYTPELLPYNPRSYPAYLLGATITTRGGWARKITKADCGVIDAFLVLLRYRGVEPEGGLVFGDHISTMEIARRIVEYWVSLVMSGTLKVGDWKGVKVGMRRVGDRIWREEDIDWSQNLNRWLEDKSKEFEEFGLPSWVDKGFKGPFKLPETISSK